MKDNVQPTPIDWEQRKYDLAVALYYHDIRLSDVVTPENRLTRWPAHISLSAEMAVEAAEVFINAYRRQAVMESGEIGRASCRERV